MHIGAQRTALPAVPWKLPVLGVCPCTVDVPFPASDSRACRRAAMGRGDPRLPAGFRDPEEVCDDQSSLGPRDEIGTPRAGRVCADRGWIFRVFLHARRPAQDLCGDWPAEARAARPDRSRPPGGCRRVHRRQPVRPRRALFRARLQARPGSRGGVQRGPRVRRAVRLRCRALPISLQNGNLFHEHEVQRFRPL